MKKNTLKNILIIIVLFILGVGVLGFATSGFTNWNKDDMKDRFINSDSSEEPVSETSDVLDTLSMKKTKLISLTFTEFKRTATYAKYGTEITGWQLTYTFDSYSPVETDEFTCKSIVFYSNDTQYTSINDVTAFPTAFVAGPYGKSIAVRFTTTAYWVYAEFGDLPFVFDNKNEGRIYNTYPDGLNPYDVIDLYVLTPIY